MHFQSIKAIHLVNIGVRIFKKQKHQFHIQFSLTVTATANSSLPSKANSNMDLNFHN